MSKPTHVRIGKIEKLVAELERRKDILEETREMSRTPDEGLLVRSDELSRVIHMIKEEFKL